MQFLTNGWKKVGENFVHETAIVYPHVKLGRGNYIGPYTIIGGNGEIRGKDQSEFQGEVIIGDDNVISELVTIQRPFDKGAVTTIGSRNLIMAHCHIGHDVEIQDDCEICAHAILGGYSKVFAGAKLKMNTTIRNRKIVAINAVVGMCAVVTKNVPPGTTVYGNPAREHPILRG